MAAAKTRKPRPPRAAARKRRAGLPDKASIVAQKTFTSPKGTAYRILKTDEKDAYDDRHGAPAKPRRR
ncbi:MAG TPA: hypothetical protein VMV26_12705 [Alphaproteobacteria bacterium]|jgi:hypothetical protein|nr:hypothetical protein [Alphaproteobacteria bacterium]